MGKKKDLVLASLRNEKTGYIPVIPAALSYHLAHCGIPLAQVNANSNLFAEMMISGQQKFGFDGLWAGAFMGVESYWGVGRVDRHGRISTTGEGTVNEWEDLVKLPAFQIENCEAVATTVKRIEALKRQAPDEPILLIVDNASMTAATLMGGANYYYQIIHNPAFVHELTAMALEPLIASIQSFVSAGCDIIWLPMPTVGGTCIAKKHYQEFCHPYNIQLNEKIREMGAYVVQHTCGNWNDRFDLATAELAHCLHTSEADLAVLKQNYGANVAFMGQVPVVKVLLEKTAAQVEACALEQCLTMAEQGGFVLSADCGVTPLIAPENMQAMVTAARRAEKIINAG